MAAEFAVPQRRGEGAGPEPAGDITRAAFRRAASAAAVGGQVTSAEGPEGTTARWVRRG